MTQDQDASKIKPAQLMFSTWENGNRRELWWTPGYDARPTYGIHGAHLTFVIRRDDDLAIELNIYTGWTPTQTSGWDSLLGEWEGRSFGWGLSCHSVEPQFEDQVIASHECKFLGNRPCYCSDSIDGGREGFHLLANAGPDEVWKMLEQKFAEALEGQARQRQDQARYS